MPSHMAALPRLTSLLRTPEDQWDPFLQSAEQSELLEALIEFLLGSLVDMAGKG